ncbi:hypothetical protein OSC27_11405 [Microbacterium sp. STN6]|uniref:hypothetical protein n=1 Tax=Microbacterium sp. STN6 TaxID=2995588 RepID=UPI002260CEAC|nr:hypothetical protein [Microbacterium sp. STN6]MCX7522880.1 hypothetical protein [Microbacterium sp. STN6]
MKRVWGLVIGAVVVAGVGAGTTLALWNNSQTSGAATLKTGVLTVAVGGQSTYTVGPLSALYPGSVVPFRFTVNGAASGHLGLTASMQSVSLADPSPQSAALFNAMTAQLYVQTSPSDSCTSSATPTGTQLYGSSGAFAPLNSMMTAPNILIPVGAGMSQPDHTARASAYLCMRLSLPAATPATIGGVNINDATTSFRIVVTGQGVR